MIGNRLILRIKISSIQLLELKDKLSFYEEQKDQFQFL